MSQKFCWCSSVSSLFRYLLKGLSAKKLYLNTKKAALASIFSNFLSMEVCFFMRTSITLFWLFSTPERNLFRCAPFGANIRTGAGPFHRNSENKKKFFLLKFYGESELSHQKRFRCRGTTGIPTRKYFVNTKYFFCSNFTENPNSGIRITLT